jgi:hypothetical protein
MNGITPNVKLLNEFDNIYVRLRFGSKEDKYALKYEMTTAKSEGRLFGVEVPSERGKIPLIYWCYYSDKGLHTQNRVVALKQSAAATLTGNPLVVNARQGAEDRRIELK